MEGTFDVESYLRCELKMGREEEFDVIEMDGTELEAEAAGEDAPEGTEPDMAPAVGEEEALDAGDDI